MRNELAKKTIPSLLSLLSQEYQFYKELEQLLIEERDCIVNMQNEELTNINFKKESLLLNILEIKNEREEILNQISNYLNIKKDDISISFLLKTFPEYEKDFAEFKIKFKKIGQKIKSLNDINKHILNSSLNFIKSSLNIFYQNSNRAVYTNFGKVRVNKSYMAKSSFSSKI